MADEKEITEKQGTENTLSAPVESIENCKAITEKLYKEKADSIMTAEEIYAITGPKGTMSPKVSACIQYGLMENNPSGKGYRITDFGISIIRPEFPDTNFMKKKLLEAFSKPELYKKLIDRYNSKGLPNQKGLTNILVTEFGFNANSTGPRASYIFLENCGFLNLNDGGRLRYFMPNVSIPEGKTPVKDAPDSLPTPPPDNNTFRLPIDLGEKTACLEYPKDITEDEIEELKIMVDASISALLLRKRRNKNPIV